MMTDEMTLDLWRLATDLTVVDAAILIAGGIQVDVDHELDTFGITSPKRTDGHRDLQPLPAFDRYGLKGLSSRRVLLIQGSEIGAHDDHATKIFFGYA
ncbi:MAG: hypothetical protein R3D63_02820 [Paracoccaceae bacterium]